MNFTYINFRKATFEKKIDILNEYEFCDEDFRYDFYYFSHHDSVYGNNEFEFFNKVDILDIKKFIDGLIDFIKKSLKFKENDLIACYCLLLSISNKNKKGEEYKNKIKNQLLNHFKILWNNNKNFTKEIISITIPDIIDVEAIINRNKKRNDVNFTDIPNITHASIGEVKYFGSSLPYSNILNINAHNFNPEQRLFFDYYISSEELYEQICKEQKKYREKIIYLKENNKIMTDNLNYLSENKIFILNSIIDSLNNNNYYAALSSLVNLTEDIFKNIIFEELPAIILKKYDLKQYDKKTFILKSPPLLTDYLKEIIKYSDIKLPIGLNNKYKHLNYNLILNIELILKSSYGLYIRNSISHGCLGENDLNYEAISEYLIYIILCLCLKS